MPVAKRRTVACRIDVRVYKRLRKVERNFYAVTGQHISLRALVTVAWLLAEPMLMEELHRTKRSIP